MGMCNIGWLLESNVLAAFKVKSGWVPTGDSVHSRWLHSTSPLGNQATGTMIWDPTQSLYPDGDTEINLPYIILLILSTRLGSFYNSLVWLDQQPNFWSSTHKACALPIRPPSPVICNVYYIVYVIYHIYCVICICVFRQLLLIYLGWWVSSVG